MSFLPHEQTNFTATVDPTATDDATLGYSVGSEWINNTADTFWVCVDNTASAAVWKDCTSGGGAVSSVFGRSGAVVAVSGDYDADKITETASREFVAPADNTKLGHISVTQAVDLDTMESNIATNNAKVSFPEAPNDGSEYVRKSLGWSVASGGGLATKSGVVTAGSFSGNPKKSTVTFGSAFASANYSIAIIGHDGDKYTITADSITTGGFDINLNSNSAPSNTVLWIAILHGET